MYEEGTPRPPTAADMARRELPLELIRIQHHLFCFPAADPAERAELERLGSIDYGCTWDRHLESMSILSTADLIALHQGYGIPYDATLSTIDYEGELGLCWFHLLQCEECDGWYGPGESDAHRAGDYHAAVVMGRNAPPPILSEAQLRALGRPVPGDAVVDLDGLGPV